MTRIPAVFVVALLLASFPSARATARTAEAPNVTGTWNMGLQGGHVVPVALTLEQNGTAVSGVILLPTQRSGERLRNDGRDVEGAARHGVVERRTAESAQVKPLSRRAVLRGLGATVALPVLDAMMPAKASAAARRRLRLVCVEMVHGAAGSSAIGIRKNLWAPASTGRGFDLGPTSLRSLEPFRDHLTIVSNTDVDPAEPFSAREIGGDHFRSSAVFLTQAHPKQTQGGDVEAGISLDQLYARRVGHETPIPSLQLCIEAVDQAGGCGYGYSCVYTDSISWASPTRPLPMVRDPRVVFDELFGVLGAGASPAERRARREEDRSILDGVRAAAARLKGTLGAADRVRLSEYLEHLREVERRLQAVEAFNAGGEVRELPEAPAGVPDSFAAHVRLMFDLQL